MAETKNSSSGRSEDGGDRELGEDPLALGQGEAEFRKSSSV